jgi:hypothetical protein
MVAGVLICIWSFLFCYLAPLHGSLRAGAEGGDWTPSNGRLGPAGVPPAYGCHLAKGATLVVPGAADGVVGRDQAPRPRAREEALTWTSFCELS